jgi:tellurite resistance protein TerC
METIGSPAAWLGFTALVLVLLVLDLAVFHRKAHTVRVREALGWTLFWIALAMAFNGLLWAQYGSDRALEFLTAYLLEKALSIDNLFVFLILFASFKVPSHLQHRVLFWGILGAMVMRAIFILAGAALLQHFHWVIYLFGAFLVFTGIKLLLHKHDEDPTSPSEPNRILRWLKRVIPTTSDYRGSHFTVVENGKRLATPLLVVLLAVEASDVVFAVDSVPAVFGVTEDPFIVYTSNIFAILGLRALYFVLASALERFHYLPLGLALVLTFIGGKMLASGVYHVPVTASLAVVVGVLVAAVTASWIRSLRNRGSCA